jgi:hypothetical protein
MRIRTINHTGKTRIVKYIEGKWTDLELETFKVISKKLKLTMLDLNGLNDENEIAFIKAFFPNFDEKTQVAYISKMLGDIGYCFFIEIWI